MTFRWILLFLMSMPTAKAADECSPIRLDEVGGSMEHVQIHDQEQIGDCYAHAAAQIFDAWRFRNGDRRYLHQSSGFEINQRYKIYRDDDDIDGGLVTKTLPLLVQEGTCSDAELNKKFKNITTDQYASGAMRIYESNAREFQIAQDKASKEIRYRQSEASQFQDNLKLDITPYLITTDQYYRGVYLNKGIKELKAYHAKVLNVPFDDKRLDKIIPNADTVAMFETIGLIECSNQDKIRTHQHFSYKRHDHTPFDLYSLSFKHQPNAVIQQIQAELNLGKKEAMPVAIGYCAKVLKEGKAFTAKDFNGESCGRHASLVIGRRRNPETQKCQYLIRNTWGKSCSYSKDWQCEKEKGSVWVDTSILKKAVYETLTLRR